MTGLASDTSTVLTTTITYAVQPSDRGKLILADATAGVLSINLPACAVAGKGFTIKIKKKDSSANAITNQASGAETIDGSNTTTLSTQYKCQVLQTDGVSWYIINSY
jgi:hypothetical protein